MQIINTMPPRKSRQPTLANASESASSAKALADMTTKTGTKENYKGKQRIMIDWLKVNHPSCVNRSDELKIPVSNGPIISFFGNLAQPAHDRSRCNEGDPLGPDPMSVSCIRGYRSALVFLYTKVDKKLSEKTDTELTKLLDGYEKLINDLRKRGLMKVLEGKRHLQYNGYSLLCDKFMKLMPGRGDSWSMVTFCWSFFVLMWNLMSRSDSIDTIMLQHISWEGDALIIEEQGHKGDQTGADKYGKHVYANPYEPNLCPILALAILLFSCPNRPDHGRQQLFSGNQSKDRFGHLLRETLKSLSEEELYILGCIVTDLGMHSCRKGSCTYCLGQVNGPTPVSVLLRMGQTLGKLKDRYIHVGEGADQLCGRMVCGLPFNNEAFGVLPPHFGPDVLCLLTEDYWGEIVPGNIKNYFSNDII